MFANTLRGQARLAFSVCRASTVLRASRNLSSNHAHASLALCRRHMLPPTIFLRNLSDSVSSSQTPTSPSTNTLYIQEFPDSTTTTELTRVFEQFGPVKDVRIGGKNKLFAHVEFEDANDAAKAFESSKTNPINVEDQTLAVSLSTGAKGNRTLVLSGLDASQENDIRALFDGLKIVDVRFNKGHGLRTFVDFDAPQTAAEVLKKVEPLGMGFRHLNPTSNALVCDAEPVNLSIFEGFSVYQVRHHRTPPALFVEFIDSESAAEAYKKALADKSIGRVVYARPSRRQGKVNPKQEPEASS